MILNIPEMSCGHCRAAVEAAVAGVDAGARVTVDLATRRAEIVTSAAPEAVIAALAAAGYAAAPAG
ncbi:copper chaperone [Frigidibacter albus]|uniref:Copper chaperone n=1 Tax=Frigidibacter albus TaxID=1465486 RepID=A0A6L8VJE0_9RHOB|nr:cation transporter [Frigidibacter albus]MZQ90333.1 copper chaperone [Frigidibacter albus]NBE32169.1 copper chaperone [Frigidibacter albus]GGH58811.1 hypothetical protein GCM10011341_29510 [Frigidibacter albus]